MPDAFVTPYLRRRSSGNRVQRPTEGRGSGRRLSGARSRHVKATSRAPCSLMRLFITMQLARCVSAGPMRHSFVIASLCRNRHGIDAITCERNREEARPMEDSGPISPVSRSIFRTIEHGAKKLRSPFISIDHQDHNQSDSSLERRFQEYRKMNPHARGCFYTRDRGMNRRFRRFTRLTNG